MISPETLLACAVNAAKIAGQHALQNIDRRNEVAKGFQHDVKLNLDSECQSIAEESIKSLFPDHAILGEESDDNESASSGSDYLWILDPIDGTVNFSHGFIMWCNSIAVRYKGETVAGVIFAPVLNELYAATSGKQSTLNGKEIHVSNVESIKASMVHTGIDRNTSPERQPYAVFKALAENTQKVRITGSAALDLCRVACGQADGYYESHIYLWDAAAAEFIVRQAGGKTTIWKSDEAPHRIKCAASNGLIHEELLALIGISDQAS